VGEDTGPLTAATRAALTGAGRTGTPGAALLQLLAARLESEFTPPQAIAGLSGQYRATLAETVPVAPEKGDAVDEIAQRRQAKRAAAGGA